MAKSINKGPKGFTLVELMIYLGISSIALLVFTSFMADVTKSATKAHISQEIQQNARLVISQIAQDIRTAQSIQSVSAQTIELTNQENEETSYFISGDTLQYQIAGFPAEQLSNDRVRVTNFNLEQNDNAISIELTVKQKSETARASERDTITLESTVVPRQLVY